MGLSWKHAFKRSWRLVVCGIGLVLAAQPVRAEDLDGTVDDEAVFESNGRAPASAAPKAGIANGVTVLQLDPRFPVARLRRAGFRVRAYAEINREDPWRDPSVNLRDDIFARAGLQEGTKDWDALAKDMLFLRAQDQPLERLAKSYPKFSRSTLVSLQRIIRRAKGRKR